MPFVFQDPNPKESSPKPPINITVHLTPPFFYLRAVRSIPFYEGFTRRDEDVVLVGIFGWIDYPEGASGNYGYVFWMALHASSLSIYRCHVAPLPFGDWERLQVAVLRYFRQPKEEIMAEVAFLFSEAFEHAFDQAPVEVLDELTTLMQSLMTIRHLKHVPDPEEVKMTKLKLLTSPSPKKRKKRHIS